MAPLVPPGRIVGLDVARCLALVGMIATHALPTTDADGVTLVQHVAGGRASALFALLAGVSLALMSGRTTPLAGRDRWAVAAGLAVRALLIALVGLVLGELGTSIAVILTYYGVLFLLGIPFLGLRARSLAVLSGLWVVAVPVLSHVLRPHLPERGYASPTLAALTEPGRLLAELTFTGYYPAVPWLAYLLAGMAVGRLDLSRRRTALDLAVLGGLLAAGSWAASRLLLDRPEATQRLVETFTGPGKRDSLETTLDHGLYGTTPTGSWWWLAVESPHTATPFDLAHTIGSALLVVGLGLLLGRAAPRTCAVVFAAGAMTLTLYSLHVMLRTPLFFPADDLGTFALHVAVVLLVGAAYRLAGRGGPLERMVTAAATAVSDGVRGSERAVPR